MDTFPGDTNYQSLLSRVVPYTKENKFGAKIFFATRTLGLDYFISEFYQAFKEKVSIQHKCL